MISLISLVALFVFVSSGIEVSSRGGKIKLGNFGNSIINS